MVVTGSVGSGKTELLRTFAHEAVDSGAIFLSATASRTQRVVPLGVMGELCAHADIPGDRLDRASRLLSDGGGGPGREGEPGPQEVTAPVLHALTAALLELSERAPLLIGVDDVHFADLPSLQCLLSLVHRSVRSRIMLVVNEAVLTRQPRPIFRADLLSQPQCRQIRLSPLSAAGVTEVLANRLDPDTAAELTAACHQMTGGNPLLLGALIEDFRAAGDPCNGPVPGDAFGQAVMTCLYRSDYTMLRLARVLAILRESATPTLIAELLGLNLVSTVHALDIAGRAGLLDDGQFRHARARAAVLDAMSPKEHAAAHERAANLLYKNGAPAVVVARHEIAAHHVGASWSPTVLRDAAEHALEQHDTPLALECLRLAERACTNEAERAVTRAALVRAQWPFDPITADRHVTDLLSATRAGHLGGRAAVELMTYLIWNGRTTEAVELLRGVAATTPATESETIGALHSAQMQFAYAYPALAGQLLDAAPTSASGLSTRVIGVVDSLMTGEVTETVLVDAERVLQQARLDASDCVPVLAAMDTLTRADRLDTATRWCEALLREADERRAPAWRALRSAVCAVVLLRRGDLTAANLHARASLACVRPKSLGVFIGVPLSVLLQVAARTGNEQDGLDHLNVPVPQAMFQTPFGLRYMRSRGRFHLSQGDAQAAMVDFMACRDLAVAWDLDLPEFLTWRTDLAEAHLALGQHETARELAESQLMRLGSYNGSIRAVTLRVLAAASDVAERSGLLREAIEILVDKDRFELAAALRQLSEVQRELGDLAEARDSARLASYAVGPQRAEEPSGEEPRPAEPAVPRQRESGEEGHPVELSEAEQRVAELAARGHTNQQIASKLYVTVSTVEQHLTRVYRKLNVNRRKDLAQKLLCYSSSASPPLSA